MTISVFVAQAHMEAEPGHEVHKKDLTNGDNEVDRRVRERTTFPAAVAPWNCVMVQLLMLMFIMVVARRPETVG